MAQQTLKPPSATLYLATGLAGGFTIAAWATVFLGIVMFRSIPPERQATYLILGLLTAATTKILGIRLIIGRERYARHVAAQWEAAKARRQAEQAELLDGDEDRALWASIPAAGSDEDTCAFTATNVIAINQYRSWPQAG
ncbi:hypothetical protein [Micromonospora aurantiaca]|uniref:Uncharacterized protein n=1 Tax=Micromonospora aurantiaca (nom. illeg.) TaxID=47850 RepID=A0A6N3JY34_9ACTN|nr:hypothetical protein [Micromonospora aurantiaca]AXH89374.1 hypothetical protein DVH21_05170 [Micromonospora aurantiaca]